MKGNNFNHWFLQYLINVVKLRKIQVVGWDWLRLVVGDGVLTLVVNLKDLVLTSAIIQHDLMRINMHSYNYTETAC